MKLITGNCLEVLKEFDDNSIDAVVTDPPYGLKFMGKKWDYDVPSIEIWEEVLRVLKPGGYLLSFGGSRTYHRMAVAIEDAGFEIRDQIMWVYGSGFPKSLNIGKAVDKLQGNEREKVGKNPRTHSWKAEDNTGKTYGKYGKSFEEVSQVTKGNSEWEGWGTALKPAHEPIVVARKPLSEKTVAKNVLKWGTGGINIDGCRVGTDTSRGDRYNNKPPLGEGNTIKFGKREDKWKVTPGRFPANFIHDGSDEVVGLFPNTKSGNLNSGHKRGDGTGNSFMGGGGTVSGNYGGDSCSAARFFKTCRFTSQEQASRIKYCPKASKRERNAGCDELEHGNNHATVKPLKLMEYLIKLVSRDNATVLDPFMGSGTTGIACKNLNRDFIGIELDLEYYKIAKARIGIV